MACSCLIQPYSPLGKSLTTDVCYIFIKSQEQSTVFTQLANIPVNIKSQNKNGKNKHHPTVFRSLLHWIKITFIICFKFVHLSVLFTKMQTSLCFLTTILFFQIIIFPQIIIVTIITVIFNFYCCTITTLQYITRTYITLRC